MLDDIWRRWQALGCTCCGKDDVEIETNVKDLAYLANHLPMRCMDRRAEQHDLVDQRAGIHRPGNDFTTVAVAKDGPEAAGAAGRASPTLKSSTTEAPLLSCYRPPTRRTPGLRPTGRAGDLAVHIHGSRHRGTTSFPSIPTCRGPWSKHVHEPHPGALLIHPGDHCPRRPSH